MRRTVIDGGGSLQLGDQAAALGYLPGCVVDIVRLSTNSLLIRLSDDVDTIDVPPLKPLPPQASRRALGEGTRR